MQRVAVTGATGFIGRRLVHRLLADGVAVTALSRRRDPDLDRSGAAVVVGSLEDAGALSQLVEGADAVVHAAGAVRARTSQQFVETNAGSTRRLIYAAARLRPPPRLLLLSSLAAREPMLSPYAASKRAAEDALAQEARGLWWLALRPPAVYGPGDRATLPLFRAMKRGLLPVPADGSGRFSLIHVDDLTAAIVALISSDVAGGQILEVRDGAARGYSWLDLVEVAGRAAGRSVRPIRVPASILRLTAAVGGTICRGLGLSPMLSPGKVREILHPDWVCTVNPVADQTDWRPSVDVTSGFRRTFEWYAESGWI